MIIDHIRISINNGIVDSEFSGCSNYSFIVMVSCTAPSKFNTIYDYYQLWYVRTMRGYSR